MLLVNASEYGQKMCIPYVIAKDVKLPTFQFLYNQTHQFVMSNTVLEDILLVTVSFDFDK